MRACLYDPGQAGRDAYQDPAHNTNSKECLYDPATYPALTGSRQQMPGHRLSEMKNSHINTSSMSMRKYFYCNKNMMSST